MRLHPLEYTHPMLNPWLCWNYSWCRGSLTLSSRAFFYFSSGVMKSHSAILATAPLSFRRCVIALVGIKGRYCRLWHLVRYLLEGAILFVLWIFVYLYCAADNDYVQINDPPPPLWLLQNSKLLLVQRVTKIPGTLLLAGTSSLFHFFFFFRQGYHLPITDTRLPYFPWPPLALRLRPPRAPPLPLPPCLETPAPSFGFRIGDSGWMMVGRGCCCCC